MESIGKMKQRHKKELKEFDIMSSKILHSVSKKDKTGKKEAQCKIKEEKGCLLKKHKEELEGIVEESEDHTVIEDDKPKDTRARRRRENKAHREHEKEIERKQRVEEETKDMVDLRGDEIRLIQDQLKSLDLELKEIISDGNCLYRAAVDQCEYSLSWIREHIAEEMLNNSDMYSPFIELSANETFLDYCAKIRNLDVVIWGGQPEANAISRILKRPVYIYHASMPVVVLGEEYNEHPIHLTFHQHYFGLGDHFNSVTKIT